MTNKERFIELYKTNIKKYTKKHLKKYPFCTKMKINIEKGTCVLF